MKRILAILTAISLCLVIFACSEPPVTAYDLAVQNGFTGTLQQWLESLKGADGKNGENANEINIYDIYEEYLKLYPNTSFEDFLHEYLSVEYSSSQYAANVGARSIVEIYSTFTRRVNNKTETYYSAGAGVIFKLDLNNYTYIITNYHVVYEADSTASNKIAEEILLFPYGSFRVAENAIEAEFVGGSISNDIAVVRASASSFRNQAYTQARVANSNNLSIGEAVVAIGNPRGEGVSVTSGVVSVDSENIEMNALDNSSTTTIMRVIRTDTSINGGNSGGGLFNQRGELIGIVNAKIVEEGVENIGYAIPSNVAIAIAQSVIDFDGNRCLIGIATIINASSAIYDEQNDRIIKEETVIVESVSADGLSAGKIFKDDILLTAKLNDDEPIRITRSFYLAEYLYNARPNDVLTLTVERGGNVETITITLSASKTTKH